MTLSYRHRTTYENTVLARQIVELLNEAHQLDKTAVNRLCEHRVECNDALAAHSTIQVAKAHGSNTCGAAVLVEKYKVGLLGILNGICGVDENVQGFIEAVYDDNDHSNLLGFQLSKQARKWLRVDPV